MNPFYNAAETAALYRYLKKEEHHDVCPFRGMERDSGLKMGQYWRKKALCFTCSA